MYQFIKILEMLLLLIVTIPLGLVISSVILYFVSKYLLKPLFLFFIVVVNFFGILVLVFFDLIGLLNCVIRFQMTIENAKTLGHLILIDGAIRAGKTTRGCGLVHKLIRVLKWKANNVIKKTKAYLYDLDYLWFDGLIKEYRDREENPYPQLILEDYKDKILEDLQHIQVKHQLKRYDKLKQLSKYIDAKDALLRNRWVMSKTDFKEIFGGELIPWNVNNIQWKKAFIEKIFYLPKYVIIYEDEVNLRKDSLDYKRISEEENGEAECFRLIGNALEETAYYVGTIQGAERVPKKERDLYTDFKHIEKLQFKIIFRSIFKLLDRCISLIDSLENTISLFHFKNREKYLNNSNKFKSLHFVLMLKMDLLFKYSFIKYFGEYHDNPKYIDNANIVGKKNNEYEKNTECLEIVDTHEFNIVVKALRKASSISLDRAIEIASRHYNDNDKKAEEILTKKSIKTSAT